MLLPPEEAALFLALYQHLIGFAAGRLGGVKGVVDFASFRAASSNVKGEARDRLLDNIALIDAFVEENPGEFRGTDLAHVVLWRHFVRGDFVIERDLANYTVFLTQHVPARVCRKTGEQFFSPETVERIQDLIKGGKEPTRVVETPVYEYT
jgi:hypothetical protein